MKINSIKWLIAAIALAFLTLPQPIAAEEPEDPEVAIGNAGKVWLEGEPEGDPQPEISFGDSGKTWFEGEPEGDPQPEFAPSIPSLILLEGEPEEPQPESC